MPTLNKLLKALNFYLYSNDALRLKFKAKLYLYGMP